MSEEDVPEGRCGFVLEPGDLGGIFAGEFEAELDEWYERSSAACCWREIWGEGDTDRCVWHAEIDEKPVNELVEARKEGPERFDGAHLRETRLGDALSFNGCRMLATDLGSVDLENANFWRADMREANLYRADLGDADLRGVHLEGASLQRADLGGAALEGADLGGAALRRADMRGANLWRADMGGANLWRADMREANLSEAYLGDADLWRVDLGDAYLERADLGDANLQRANLGDADFGWADLRDATLEDAYLGGAALKQADLKGASLQRADLGEADLREADLRGVDLRAADLGDADLRETTLDDADLREADLWGVDLRAADLSERNLREMNFVGADLTDADLTDANLRNADLKAATLENAILTRTDLRGADLEYAELYQTLFSDGRMNNRTEFGETCQYEARDIEPQIGGDDSDVTPLEAAAWTYRRIQTLHEENALAQDAREYHVKKAEAYRKLRWREFADVWSRPHRDPWNWLTTFVRATTYSANRWLSRHGESPHRVVGVSLLVILASAVLYPLVGGIKQPPTPDGTPTVIAFDLLPSIPIPLPGPVADLATSLYFSVVTFTTLGYGDLQPASGAAQALATVESFTGALLMALLVFVLGRRATW